MTIFIRSGNTRAMFSEYIRTTTYKWNKVQHLSSISHTFVGINYCVHSNEYKRFAIWNTVRIVDRFHWIQVPRIICWWKRTILLLLDQEIRKITQHSICRFISSKLKMFLDLLAVNCNVYICFAHVSHTCVLTHYARSATPQEMLSKMSRICFNEVSLLWKYAVYL